MTLALSTVWSGKNSEDGHQIVAEAKELGFNAIELHHSLKATTVKQILGEQKRNNVQVTSLHCYCPAVQGLKIGKPSPEPFSLSSLDTYERRSAIKYAINTINFARMFQAEAIILHCGWVVMENLAGDLAKMYRQGEKGTDLYTKLKAEFLNKRRKKIERHLDRLFKGLEVLAEEGRKQHVKIGIENRYFPSEIPNFDEIGRIMEKFEGAPIFYWHDVGHAQVTEELGFTEHTQYLESYQDKLIGVHLHDNIGLADHKVPYTGTFDFEKLVPFVKPETIKALEISVAATEDELQKGIDRIRTIFNENQS